MLTVFEKKVLKFCQKIPKGKVSTYKILAKAVGRPQASRAVGNALNKNQKPIIIPCHRVVKSDGNLGGYAQGLNKKKRLLKREGVKIYNNKIDLIKYLYKFN